MAYDAFDPDVICAEFNRLKKEAEKAAEFDSDEESEEGKVEDTEEKDEKELKKGKHYLVFIFQNWSGKHKSIHFVAARFFSC